MLQATSAHPRRQQGSVQKDSPRAVNKLTATAHCQCQGALPLSSRCTFTSRPCHHLTSPHGAEAPPCRQCLCTHPHQCCPHMPTNCATCNTKRVKWVEFAGTSQGWVVLVVCLSRDANSCQQQHTRSAGATPRLCRCTGAPSKQTVMPSTRHRKPPTSCAPSLVPRTQQLR